MIEVKIIKENNFIKSVLINGHANFAKYGEDIVCASVTCLAMSLVNYFNEYLKINIEDMNFYAIENEESSLFSIDIREEDIYKLNEVQDGFKFFEIGIIFLVQDYSNYLELIYREV